MSFDNRDISGGNPALGHNMPSFSVRPSSKDEPQDAMFLPFAHGRSFSDDDREQDQMRVTNKEGWQVLAFMLVLFACIISFKINTEFGKVNDVASAAVTAKDLAAFEKLGVTEIEVTNQAFFNANSNGTARVNGQGLNVSVPTGLDLAEPFRATLIESAGSPARIQIETRDSESGFAAVEPTSTVQYGISKVLAEVANRQTTLSTVAISHRLGEFATK